MRRHLSADLTAAITSPVEATLGVTVADDVGREKERFTVTLDGDAVEVEDVLDEASGTRWHVIRDVPPGQLAVSYSATVTDGGAGAPVSPLDRIHYVRPSRYVDLDRLEAVARAEVGDVDGEQGILDVAAWVHEHIRYVIGSSAVTDGASDTYLSRTGVCRDFAHLTLALLRARGIPARLVACYAPGLSPMDFHAVVEAAVGDRWVVVDPTRLAPRQSLVRISAGADASETSFLTVHSGGMNFQSLQVSAVTDGDLPRDDHGGTVSIG
ncbi:transglutaminase domain protein [Serinicoccus hydrothermalis]|uniref:Transglutaminase domain protein n=1 Tax=Serinicoccus hydrothermalis TaxID=1758689 RepID=A0A1B1NBW6_9MICO|nr:transglutaminase family protein [Serinicoccus hydrothermalis]ANS78939.1 transglutaminase domain protein [Serinicoccus hydrothermalis]